MTTEEKAKLYDKALETARELYNNPNSSSIGKAYLYTVFHELKESKDEKIRKVIRGWINTRPASFFDNGISKEEMLAWLEKQCDKLQSKTALEASKEEKVDNANYVSISETFSIGNWVVANACTRYRAKIEAFIGNGMVEFEDGTFETEENLLNDYHLWTIQDANDGDVLVHNSITFIFKGIEDGIVKGLCPELGDPMLNFGKPEYDKDYHPATKEQSDLLFSKMKEAGYEWDADKKELRKTENSPILSNSSNTGKQWSEEDEHHWMMCVECVEECATQEREDFSKTINWLYSIKQRMEGKE